MAILETFKAILVSAMLTTGYVPEVPMEQAACLMEATYFEAGGETSKGKDAVAHAILNRRSSDVFPDNICDIVRQRGQFSYHTRNKRTFKYNQNNDKMVKDLRDSAESSLKALTGKSKDPTNGAMFFINPKIATYTDWLAGYRKTAIIGNHAFYKLPTKKAQHEKILVASN